MNEDYGEDCRMFVWFLKFSYILKVYGNKNYIICILILKEIFDGRRKIVDLIDVSGSGDVDTLIVCEVVDGCFNGVIGRRF